MNFKHCANDFPEAILLVDKNKYIVGNVFIQIIQCYLFFSDQISTKKILLIWNGGVSFNVLEKNVCHQYVLNKLTCVQRDKQRHVKQLEFGVVEVKWIIGAPPTVSANGHIVQHLIANVNQVVIYLCPTFPYGLLSSSPL